MVNGTPGFLDPVVLQKALEVSFHKVIAVRGGLDKPERYPNDLIRVMPAEGNGKINGRCFSSSDCHWQRHSSIPLVD